MFLVFRPVRVSTPSPSHSRRGGQPWDVRTVRKHTDLGITFSKPASLTTAVCFGREAQCVGLDVSQTDLSCFLSQRS